MKIPEHAAQVLAPMCATHDRRDDRLARDASDEDVRRAEAGRALDDVLPSARRGSRRPYTAATRAKMAAKRLEQTRGE